jgi:hypothetical protein
MAGPRQEGLAAALGAISGRPQGLPELGIIREIKEHPKYGRVAMVECPGLPTSQGTGAVLEVRLAVPAWGASSVRLVPPEVGMEVVVVFPGGNLTRGVGLVSGTSDGQAPGVDEWFVPGVTGVDGFEVRSAAGDQVYAVVTRKLLDDLVDAIEALRSFMGVLTSPSLSPGTEVQNAALLTALRIKADLAVVGTEAVLGSFKTQLDIARGANGGLGGRPYCSPVLLATDQGGDSEGPV